MMIKACIFDLDGTLLNTVAGITYFINRTLSHYGIPAITEEETKRFIGNGARKLIERTLASMGIADPDLNERVLREYNDAYDRDNTYLTLPYDGIPETLSVLKARGIRLGVLSNKPDRTAKATVSHFFPNIFDCVLGGRDGIPLKPDPAGAREIFCHLGVMPEEVLYFGDTATDMMTGHSAGACRTVGVLWGFRDRKELEEAKADLLIAHPSELLSLF